MEKTAIQIISLETHTHIVSVSLFLNEDGVVSVSKPFPPMFFTLPTGFMQIGSAVKKPTLAVTGK